MTVYRLTTWSSSGTPRARLCSDPLELLVGAVRAALERGARRARLELEDGSLVLDLER